MTSIRSNTPASAKKATHGGTVSFLRLADGEDVDVVIPGYGQKLEGTWRNDRFVPFRDEYASEGLSPSVRYAIPVIRLDTRQAAIIDVHEQTLLDWAQTLPRSVKGMVVRLHRTGGYRDRKARTSARVVRPLKNWEADELDEVVLPDLETVYADFLRQKST